MSTADRIEIVTIYNAAHTSRGASFARLLGLVSLIAAGAWLWTVNQRVDPWLQEKLIIAGIGQMGSLLDLQPADGRKLTDEELEAATEAAETSARETTILAGSRFVWTRLAYLTGGWLALGGLTGLLGRQVVPGRRRKGGIAIIFLLAVISGGVIWYMTGQVGADRRHLWIDGTCTVGLVLAGVVAASLWGALRMQKQAAVLILLSTLASLAGIYVAIHLGNMPAISTQLYAKVAAVQSAYAWFLLIAVRLVR
jgi:hypothetical protein